MKRHQFIILTWIILLCGCRYAGQIQKTKDPYTDTEISGKWLAGSDDIYVLTKFWLLDYSERPWNKVLTAYENPTKSKEIG